MVKEKQEETRAIEPVISSVNEIKNIDDPSSDDDADLTKHDEDADDFLLIWSWFDDQLDSDSHKTSKSQTSPNWPLLNQMPIKMLILIWTALLLHLPMTLKLLTLVLSLICQLQVPAMLW